MVPSIHKQRTLVLRFWSVVPSGLKISNIGPILRPRETGGFDKQEFWSEKTIFLKNTQLIFYSDLPNLITF